MTPSALDQLAVLLAAGPYVAAWWWALRIVCGKRFVPMEWIPLALCAFGVPCLLNEFLAQSSVPAVRPAVVGAWMALPAPVILGHLLRRRRPGGQDPDG